LGLTILFSASVSLKQDPYFYLDKQVVGVVAAASALLRRKQDQPRLRTARVRLDRRDRAGPPRPRPHPHLGVSVKGSRRWLGYGSARLQVSEFAKLAMVFCLAHYLALNQTRIGDLRRGYLYPLWHHRRVHGIHPP
jgi:cell division protein FtsW